MEAAPFFVATRDELCAVPPTNGHLYVLDPCHGDRTSLFHPRIDAEIRERRRLFADLRQRAKTAASAAVARSAPGPVRGATRRGTWMG